MMLEAPYVVKTPMGEPYVGEPAVYNDSQPSPSFHGA